MSIHESKASKALSGLQQPMMAASALNSTSDSKPETYEIERKFLIEYPDIEFLESNPDCKRAEIVQTYLKSEDGDEVRVRQRCENDCCTYFKTTKKAISGIKRIETEASVNKDEYMSLLKEADKSKMPIRKTRYCLTFEGQCFEIDIYPFWKDKAIMEIELKNENDEITFPKYIKVIKEVTADERYKNASLASNTRLCGSIV